MKKMEQALIGLSLLVVLAGRGFCQNTLQFTGINATSEKAFQLHWASKTNEVYEVDYADQLAGNPDGSTAWGKLYDNYPSHGTNTFIGDFGNYFLVPPILHPNKMPMRFYRVVDKGTNSASAPSVTITSITNGAILSDQITVSVVVTSSLPVITATLYVDGQEMDSSEDGTNFIINTCEWPNGPHVLFATAKAQSTMSGPSGSFPIDIGRGVSAYKSVTFDNLIHKIAFSEPFFEPSLGQTQQVTAAFAANVDWTLQIIDQSSNAVRTVTGSGTSLLFNWDGTGDGGTNIPDGVYHYLFSAETNGQAFLMISGDGNSFSNSTFDDATKLWALPENSENPVPFALYPPGFDTKGFTIFEASQAEVQALITAAKPATMVKSKKTLDVENGGGVMAAMSSSSSQGAVAPMRPPTNPVKGTVGTVGVAFFHFVDKKTYAEPNNGFPPPLNKVQIEGSTGNVTFDYIPEAPGGADKFLKRMAKGGWKQGFKKEGADGSLRINDLRRASLGGNEIFGDVNIGFFIGHGSYGTSADNHSDASGSRQTYFPSDNSADAGAPWLRLSELGLGGNLRWMAILACNTLRDQNYTSMKNAGVLPIPSNLHLLCGATTICGMNEVVGELWSTKMLGKFFTPATTIEQAWYGAGQEAYKNATVFSSPVIFRVAGSGNCFSDTLQSYSEPDGDITETQSQVWP
ncbi:MAG: DUF6345 domain-containing protein [Limisphaerales bacterium]